MKKRMIRFGDVTFDRKARERIHVIMDSNHNTEGKYVEKFEAKFAETFGFRHAIATSSGTTAGEVLWMAVRERAHLEWGGGYVITPALAFVATANCIVRAGLKPRFIDIEPDLNMATPNVSERSWNLGVQFVLNMGRTARIDQLHEFAKQRGMFFAVVKPFLAAT